MGGGHVMSGRGPIRRRAMQPCTREVLEIFVERADLLRDSPFAISI